MRFQEENNKQSGNSESNKNYGKIVHIKSLNDLPVEVQEELKKSKNAILEIMGLKNDQEKGFEGKLLEYIAFQNLQITHLQREISGLLEDIIPSLASIIDGKADRVSW